MSELKLVLEKDGPLGRIFFSRPAPTLAPRMPYV